MTKHQLIAKLKRKFGAGSAIGVDFHTRYNFGGENKTTTNYWVWVDPGDGKESFGTHVDTLGKAFPAIVKKSKEAR